MIGDRCYSTENGAEFTESPFPLPKEQAYSHTGDVIAGGSLAAVKESALGIGTETGIQLWDCARKNCLPP